MLDAIIGWLFAVGAGALALLGLRWKWRGDAEREVRERRQAESDEWAAKARSRVEEIRRGNAGKAPIDPKDRRNFE